MLAPVRAGRRGGAFQTPPGPRGSNGKGAYPGAVGFLPEHFIGRILVFFQWVSHKFNFECASVEVERVSQMRC